MNTRKWLYVHLVGFIGLLAAPLLAMPTDEQPDKQPDKKDFGGKKDFPFGGFGGPMNQRRKLLAQFDKNGDGWLNAEERAAAREFIKKNPQGKGLGKGPGGFGKGFGKGGFGPGMFMSKPLMEAVDADKDGKISKDELLAGVKKFFAIADKDKQGSLTEEQLAEALNAIIPQPTFGFGGKDGFKGPKDGFKDPKDAPKDGFKGPKDGPKDGPKGFPGFIPPGKLVAGEIFKRADSKKSGKVSLEDLNAAANSLFKELDKEKTGKLDEAQVANGIAQVFPPPQFGPGGFGKGGFGKDPAKPGPKVAPAEVKSYPDKGLYEPTILRTIFIEFENRSGWEAELADFYRTDVDVPATVIVDGKSYKNVGVHFRGNSSYFGVPQGYKHSLNLSFDFIDTKQRLYNYKTLNLLNCNQDPTMMHSALFCAISGKYIPSPKANLVKVVINGESWGIFANQQQFNKDFVKENYNTTKGARWKVPGHPGAAQSGLSYLGEDIAAYKRHYEIKSKDDEKDWKALIELCRVLNQTPADKLEAALTPIMDIDHVLWFLAIDNVLINDDGYWTRASDFNLYRDVKGKFHILQTDTNESMQPMGGFGFGGPKGGFGKGPKDGPGGKDGKDGKGPKDFGGFGKGGFGGQPNYSLDPLVGLNDSRAPLRSKLLAAPSLRAKYLKYVHTIARDSLDWKTLGPVVAQYRSLIEKEVEVDTRKLSSLADFRTSTADVAMEGPGSRYSLRAFADGRRAYLLSHPEVKKAGGEK